MTNIELRRLYGEIKVDIESVKYESMERQWLAYRNMLEMIVCLLEKLIVAHYVKAI